MADLYVTMAGAMSEIDDAIKKLKREVNRKIRKYKWKHPKRR